MEDKPSQTISSYLNSIGLEARRRFNQGSIEIYDSKTSDTKCDLTGTELSSIRLLYGLDTQRQVDETIELIKSKLNGKIIQWTKTQK
jgi:hypothetical protein